MTLEEQLSGGHPNSLGNTEKVVEQVLSHPELFEELFNCYFSVDEVVRLRTSSALKRIAKREKKMLMPYLDRLQQEIAAIDQASVHWTLAQLFELYEEELSPTQHQKALEIMKNNLANHRDWIVLNQTMATLCLWSAKDEKLKEWVIPQLERLQKDTRKSVAKRALKLHQGLKS